ncbi:MAG: PorT family protein [Hymenobacter sp.]|nr:MAG: PorT family protein [Hymenobacter sp.]
MLRLATFLCPILLLSVATASAQISFHLGVRGGLNRALTTVDAAGTQDHRPAYGYSSDKSAIYTWQVGAVADVGFGKISLQPALVFTQKGERFHTFIEQGDLVYASSATTGTTRSNWLELPLNVVYTLHGDHGLQVFAGPYLALAVGGRQQGTVDAQGSLIYTQPRDFDNAISYGAGTTNRRLDAGISFGIGYRQGPVQVQVGYELGLRNLHQPDPSLPANNYYHDFNGDAAYNRVAQLTGTYFFSL